MNHKTKLDYIIFWSSLLTVLVISHKANGILTDSNDLHCTQIQCPTKCPEDSYLKSAYEEDFADYEDELLGHDPYLEEIGNFEEIAPEVELHDEHLPQHLLKERQRREVFFQEDIERCCDDQKCVCNKCADVPKCAEGHVAVEVQEGQGVPGNCCSIFRCIEKEQCQLGLKQSWWTSKCRKCSCFGESELCEQICPEEEILQSCYSEYLKKPMLNGAIWQEGSCTSCSCEQGERSCFTPLCPKLDCKETMKIEEECCAKCIYDEMDESQETVNNKEQNFTYVEEEYSIEATTLDAPIVDESIELFSTLSPTYSSFPAVEEILQNETHTATRDEQTKQPPTSSVSQSVMNDTSTTLESESVETSTSSSSAHITLSPILAIFSSASTSTKEPFGTQQHHILPSKAANTTTENPQSIEIVDQDSSTSSTSSTTAEESNAVNILEQNLSSTISTATELPAPTTVLSEISEEIVSTETPTTDSTEVSDMQTTFSSTSPKIVSTAISFHLNTSTTANPKELSTPYTEDSSSENDITFTTADPLDKSGNIETDASTDNTIISSIPVTETSTAATFFNRNLISTTTENTSTNSIKNSTSASPSVGISKSSPAGYTTSNTLTSTEHSTLFHLTSTKHTASSPSTSTEHTTSAGTSTTSSPYSATSASTTISNKEENTPSSTTTAPEPLRPLFQSYGDFVSDEGTSSTQNQMRIAFDEIDYVIMIVLFIGSLLCISLGLIIRHTKNRKKMYSSVPNSETSLSQNSTNTILTIPSYSDH